MSPDERLLKIIWTPYKIWNEAEYLGLSDKRNREFLREAWKKGLKF